MAGRCSRWGPRRHRPTATGWIPTMGRSTSGTSTARADWSKALPSLRCRSPTQRGSLTLELALGGDLTGTVNAAGDGLTLSRPDGSIALGYTGLVAYDATARHCRPRWKCGARGASGPVDPRQRCRGPGPDHHRSVRAAGHAHRVRWRGGRQFGDSVSISGNTVVVGAPVATTSHQGAAYVFTESGSVWAT